MTPKKLLIMALLVAAAGAGVFFARREKPRPDVDPFRAVDYALVSALEVKRGGKTAWRVEKGKEGWALVADEVNGGKPVAASAVRIEGILSYLKDSRPLAQSPADAVDLKALGLEPASAEFVIVDAHGAARIAVGRPDVKDETAYRKEGASTVFTADARIAELAAVAARDLRDPLLLPFQVASVRKIEVKRGTDEPFFVERLGARWALRRGAAFERGDSERCDGFVNGLAGLAGEPVTAPAAPKLGPSVLKVFVHADGLTEPLSVDIQPAADDPKRLLAVKQNDPDLWRLPTNASALTGADYESLRSRFVTGLSVHDLAGVTIAKDGTKSLELVQRRGFWGVVLADGRVWGVDQDLFNAFRDKLLNLPVAARRAAAPEGKANVEVRFAFATATPVPDLVLTIVAEGEEFWARRSDEPGGLKIAAEHAKIFDARSWSLMRRVLVTGDDRNIDLVAIADQTGTARELVKNAEGKWTIGNFEPPIEALRGLLGKLVAFGVADIRAEDDAAKAGLEKPKFAVTWRYRGERDGAEGAPVDRTRVWKIGRIVRESWYECSLSDFPGMIFEIRSDELNLINDALRALPGSR